MTAPTRDIQPDAEAERPIYSGLEWIVTAKGDTLWRARSLTTPITYAVEEIDAGCWSARQGYPELAGRPNIEFGRYASRLIAMTACERHDFRFWSVGHYRSGLDPVFMGSPDLVSDFVSALSEYERDDLLDMIAGSWEMPDGQTFAEAASYFTARKTALKQEKNGDYTITLTIAPADVPMWLLQTPLGIQVATGMARLEDPAQDEWHDRAIHALKRSFTLAQDNAFQAWLGQKYDRWGLIRSATTKTSEEVEEAVSETLRRIIACPSRRDLQTNRDAIVKLEKIDREYYLDMSRGFGAEPGSL